MNEENLLKLRVSWDHDKLPADMRCDRGLLIEIEAAHRPQQTVDRPPLRLALAIDASGSMANGSLEAAREAAIGICNSLRSEDRLSVVSFDDQTTVHVRNLPQDADGRASASRAIDAIRVGGTTNLGAGWLEAADCAAGNAEGTAHVIVLSDGHANQGICDPTELAQHARALAQRGVTTSAVGIGDGYSPLQLDAIAEAGGGRLHDSATPDEIVEVVLGELGEVRETLVEEATLALQFPENCKPEVLTGLPHESDGRLISCELGAMRAGARRTLAFLVNAPSLAAGTSLEFPMRLSWRAVGASSVDEGEVAAAVLQVVDPERFSTEERDDRVARRIAELWQAGTAYTAMQFNEAGLFGAAVSSVSTSMDRMQHFVTDLAGGDELLRDLQVTGVSVSKPWSGRGKRAAYTASKKLLKGETDHRRRKTGSWKDYLPG